MNSKDILYLDCERLLISWNTWEKIKLILESEIQFLNNKIHILQLSIENLQISATSSVTEVNDDTTSFYLNDEIKSVKELILDSYDPGCITKVFLEIVDDPLLSIKIPVLICKGVEKGPIVGVTSAIHGNEVNGIAVIHKLVRELNVEDMNGTLVAVPVLNPPGFTARQRQFNSGQDLNRLFPGKLDGDRGQVFVYQLKEKLIKRIDYLIDLHTASHGRENSLYCRTNMLNDVCKNMAIVQNPQIIVHNTAPDGSARSACMALNKPAITVEIGNPSKFQSRYVATALQGVINVLSYLHMLHEPIEPPEIKPSICVGSKWYYVQHGGTLEVKPNVNTWIKKGEVIAIVRNIFGDLIAKYTAQEDGVVVGRNVDPVCQAGDRLLHLGFIGTEFPERSQDGHE